MKNSKLLTLFYFLERSVFYSLLSIIIFYLIKLFDNDHSKALEPYGVFKIFLYLTPLLMSILADYLGRKKFLVYGFLSLGIGLMLLAIESIAGSLVLVIFGIIALGSGAIRGTLPVFFIKSIENDSPKKKFSWLIIFFNISLLAIFVSPTIIPILTSGSVESYPIIITILSLGAFILFGWTYYLSKGDNYEKQVEEKEHERAKLLPFLMIVVIAIIFSIERMISHEVSFSAAQQSLSGFNNLASFIQIIVIGLIIFLLKFMKINNEAKVFRGVFVITFFYYACKSFLIWGFINAPNELGLISLISYFINLIPQSILPPVLFYLAYKYSGEKFRATGIGIIVFVFVIPLLIPSVKEFVVLSGMDISSLVLGIVFGGLGIGFMRKTDWMLLGEGRRE